MSEADNFWDDFGSVVETAIPEPPGEDGAYKVTFEVGTPKDEKNSLMVACVVAEPLASARYTILKNMTLPTVLVEQGKIPGAQFSKRIYKGAFKSAGVKDSEVMGVKAKGREGDIARAKLLHGKTGYVYFTPKVLTKEGDYDEVTFLTEAEFKAKVKDNGKKIIAYNSRAVNGEGAGKAAKSTAIESLKDLE